MDAASAEKRPIFWQILVLAGWIGLCFLAAWIGSAATMPRVPEWYASLDKPSFNPPAWVFGPVWTVLYLMMAVAAWLVWRTGGWAEAWPALAVFCGQLALNTLWSILFFGLQSPAAAAVEIVFLWLAILATLLLFARREKVAALLLVPYLAWVTFAAVLNFTIVAMN